MNTLLLSATEAHDQTRDTLRQAEKVRKLGGRYIRHLPRCCRSPRWFRSTRNRITELPGCLLDYIFRDSAHIQREINNLLLASPFVLEISATADLQSTQDLEADRRRLQETLRREVEARKRVDRMLRGYKDEVKTIDVEPAAANRPAPEMLRIRFVHESTEA